MEKELFISSLKEKSGVDNLSERTIDEVANLFLPSFTEEKEYSDDDWKMPVQMVKTMSGQLRHEVSTGINNFKTQFETENKTKQQKAIEDAIAAAKAEWEKNKPSATTPPATPPANDEKDLDTKIAEAVAKATAGLTSDDGAIGKLSKQFSDYMAQIAAEKKATTEANVREQVRDYLLARGVDEEDFALEYTLEKMVIGENPDVSVLKVKAEKDYEANYKKIHKTDAASSLNGGGGFAKDSNSEFNDFIKQKQAEAEQAAKDAEGLRKLMV